MVIGVKRSVILCIVASSLLVGVGCSPPVSSSERDDKQAGISGDCSELEPENSYSAGSGHYAGFEWAEKNESGSCGGNSSSFIEGCEEYQEQLAVYEACLSER